MKQLFEMTPAPLRYSLSKALHMDYSEEPPYAEILENLCFYYKQQWFIKNVNSQPTVYTKNTHSMIRNYRFEWAEPSSQNLSLILEDI